MIKIKNSNIYKSLLFDILIIIFYLLFNEFLIIISFPIPETLLKIADNPSYTYWILHPNEIPLLINIEFIWLIFARTIYYFTNDLLLTLHIYTLICFFFINLGIYLISKYFLKNKGLQIVSGILFSIISETFQLFGQLRELVALCFLIYFIYFLFKLKNIKNKKKYLFLLRLFCLF